MSEDERRTELRRRHLKGQANKPRPDFWSRVSVAAPDVCWPWIRYRTKDGYGQFTLYGRLRYAHRFAWEVTNGPVPEGMEVCHQCDNPPCCNPAHLFLGSQEDNVRDMIAKRRHRPPQPSRGERNVNAKLTAARVRRGSS
jgi:hypothetical protein